MYTTTSIKTATDFLQSSLYTGGELRTGTPVKDFARSFTGKTDFSHDWERVSHINRLEAEAVIFGLK